MAKQKKEKAYKATKEFKKMMPNEGLLAVSQYKALLKGTSVGLADVPIKQMNYLLSNNLIVEV